MLSAEEARLYKKNKIISSWLTDCEYEIQHIIETNNKEITHTYCCFKVHKTHKIYFQEFLGKLEDLGYSIEDYKESTYDQMDFWITFIISWAKE